MSTIATLVLEIMDEQRQPLRFRQIEAHVVIKGQEVPTSEVQRALRQLVENGELKQREDFRYEKPTTLPKK